MHVIARRYGSQPRREFHDGVEVHRVDLPFNLNAPRLLRKLIDGNERSVIHTHGTSGLFLTALGRTFRSPLVSHVHGTTRSHHMPIKFTYGDVTVDYSLTKMMYRYLRERMLWAAAKRVVTVSGAIQNDLVTHYGIPRERIRVVYSGVDTDVFQPISNPEVPEGLRGVEGRKVVLYVGHFGLRKGLLFLIQAMRSIVRSVPDAVLVCVGGVPPFLGKVDYWAFLKRAIEINDLKDKVFLLDKVPNSILPVYYSLSRVLVLPSYYEAFGKTVVEAMACSKPVVASKEGGLREVVDDGETGFLVKYGSVIGIAKAVTDILQNEDLGAEMGRKGRKRVERDFTWKAVTDRINSVYEELVN